MKVDDGVPDCTDWGRLLRIAEVGGSTPSGNANYGPVAQMVRAGDS